MKFLTPEMRIAALFAIALGWSAFPLAMNDHAQGARNLSPGPMLLAIPQVSGGGPYAILPDNIPWKKEADGTETAIVLGDMTKPGLYVQMRRWPPHAGMNSKAHAHPEDRYGYVVSGTVYQGIGDKYDPAKLQARPTGTFFFEPKGVGHFASTKDEGAVLYYFAYGPSGVIQIEK